MADGLASLKHDPVLSVFLDDNIDTSQFASTVLGNSTAATSAHALSGGIQQLELVLRTEIVARHEELLQQLGGLQESESVLTVIRSGVEGLRGVMQRIRAEISEPHRQIVTRTRQLEALSETVELLHTVIRVLKLLSKLRESWGPTKDLAKAARTLTELQQLRASADLSGVTVVEQEDAFVASVSGDLRSEAMTALHAAVDSLSQPEVGSMLQVFYNLNELSGAVEKIIALKAKKAVQAVAEALDANKLAAAAGAASGQAGPGAALRIGMPPAGNASKWQETLWQRLTVALEKVQACAVAVWHLQRVLAKKRDPVSHALFLDESCPIGPAAALPCERFWAALTHGLAEQLGKSFQAAGFVRDTLTASFPRFASLLESTFTKLVQEGETRDKASPPLIARGVTSADLLRVAEPFQNAYLAKSLARLSEAANGAFPQGGRGSPAPQDVQAFVARVREEVASASPNAALCALVISGVGKAVKLFAENCEYGIVSGPDAKQVSAPCNPAQAKNLATVTQLESLKIAIGQLSGSLPPAAAGALGSSLDALQTVATEALTPLFRAVSDRVEHVVVGMHSEPWGDDAPAAEGPSSSSSGGGKPAAGGKAVSPYMQELCKFLAHVHAEFLSRLSPQASMSADLPSRQLTRQLVARLLVLFVRHASLIRPLSEKGKLRLAQDMVELELAAAMLHALDGVGAPYRALRAFRPLLFLDTAAMAASPLLQELPPSVALLQCYSRAPADLASPHAQAGLSAAKYSAWLDSATEAEVWRGVKGTLDAYAQKHKGDAQQAPIYAVMLQIGSSSFAAKG